MVRLTIGGNAAPPNGGRARQLAATPTLGTVRVALFDFDGTIADSGPTVMGAARDALARLGHPVPGERRLRGFVGPPLMTGITEVLGVPAVAAEEFRGVYRAIYTERMTEAELYPGIRDLLEELLGEGWMLGVASSKREDLVARILEAKGMRSLFGVVAGADLLERNASKAWVLGRALDLFAQQGVDARRALLVGDRRHDVLGAAEHEIRAIFVTWGYGSPEEAAGAWAIAHSPAEVARLLAEAG